MNSNVRQAILRTFAYRSVFSYPLTFFQCYNYLLCDKKVDFSEFRAIFLQLLREKKLIYRENFFHTGGIDVLQRLERKKRSDHLLGKAQKIAGLLSFIPSVKLVCLTGAVAAENSPKDDDIDLLIVTSVSRLWLTRFIVVTLLKLMRSYRADGSEAEKVCPNIFLEESALEWDQARNIYTAHEALLMKPLVDKGGYYFRFLQSNAWVRAFLPNVEFETLDASPAGASSAESNQHSLNGLLGHALETLFMKLQLWYMRNRKTKEITTDRVIHFRRDDNTDWVMAKFESECKKLGV